MELQLLFFTSFIATATATFTSESDPPYNPLANFHGTRKDLSPMERRLYSISGSIDRDCGGEMNMCYEVQGKRKLICAVDLKGENSIFSNMCEMLYNNCFLNKENWRYVEEKNCDSLMKRVTNMQYGIYPNKNTVKDFESTTTASLLRAEMKKDIPALLPEDFPYNANKFRSFGNNFNKPSRLQRFRPMPQIPSGYDKPLPQRASNYVAPMSRLTSEYIPKMPSGYESPMSQNPPGFSSSMPQNFPDYNSPMPQEYIPIMPRRPSGYGSPMSQNPPGFSSSMPQNFPGYDSPMPQISSNYGSPMPMNPTGYRFQMPQNPPSYDSPMPQNPPNYGLPMSQNVQDNGPAIEKNQHNYAQKISSAFEQSMQNRLSNYGAYSPFPVPQAQNQNEIPISQNHQRGDMLQSSNNLPPPSKRSNMFFQNLSLPDSFSKMLEQSLQTQNITLNAEIKKQINFDIQNMFKSSSFLNFNRTNPELLPLPKKNIIQKPQTGIDNANTNLQSKSFPEVQEHTENETNNSTFDSKLLKESSYKLTPDGKEIMDQDEEEENIELDSESKLFKFNGPPKGYDDVDDIVGSLGIVPDLG